VKLPYFPAWAAVLARILEIGYWKRMRLRIFPTIEAPGQARRALSSLASQVDRHTLADLTTVVSELIGMSVANGARKSIEVSLHLDEGGLEGAVDDDGSGVRAIGRRESTLVVRILEGLVEEWGTNDSGKRIWFRMNLQPA
jgi:anti-sigma regulatory factor (Ser/Thr protein kinase)